MAKIIVNNENKKSTIAPEIYGHFSEHLGRCIYEGLFVGENSFLLYTSPSPRDCS